MPLFDRYIAVDWSAENRAKLGKDSIWIGEARRTATDIELTESANLATRFAAMADVEARCAAALEGGERVLLGFDFAFGYPVGGAAALTGTASWQSLWQRLTIEVEDAADNRSNRFHAAERLNLAVAPGGPRYWGHPWQHSYAGLSRRRPADNHLQVAEKRHVERRNRKAQPVWKLSGIGAVGSQAFLGIPHLQRLRTRPAFGGRLAIWPFDTRFADRLDSPIVVAEIFPSIIDISAEPGQIRDRLQVEAVARLFAIADAAGQLSTLLRQPGDLVADELGQVLAEEGWIVGVGHEALVAQLLGVA